MVCNIDMYFISVKEYWNQLIFKCHQLRLNSLMGDISQLLSNRSIHINIQLFAGRHGTISRNPPLGYTMAWLGNILNSNMIGTLYLDVTSIMTSKLIKVGLNSHTFACMPWRDQSYPRTLHLDSHTTVIITVHALIICKDENSRCMYENF